MILEHAKDLLSDLSKEILPGQVYDGMRNGIAVVKSVFHCKSGVVMLTADILTDTEREMNIIFTRAQFRAYFYEMIAERPSDLDSHWKDYDLLSEHPEITVYQEGEEVLDLEDIKIKKSSLSVWEKLSGLDTHPKRLTTWSLNYDILKNR